VEARATSAAAVDGLGSHCKEPIKSIKLQLRDAALYRAIGYEESILDQVVLLDCLRKFQRDSSKDVASQLSNCCSKLKRELLIDLMTSNTMGSLGKGLVKCRRNPQDEKGYQLSENLAKVVEDFAVSLRSAVPESLGSDDSEPEAEKPSTLISKKWLRSTRLE
jgi:hypothetical protein